MNPRVPYSHPSLQRPYPGLASAIALGLFELYGSQLSRLLWEPFLLLSSKRPALGLCGFGISKIRGARSRSIYLRGSDPQ